MATTYKWIIPQMDAHVQSEGKDNVIYTVHYRYEGTEESGGKTYIKDIIGAQSFTYKSGDAFVPYENTEAFENVVIGWLEGVLDVASMKTNIDADIQKQITPVDTELHFTWK